MKFGHILAWKIFLKKAQKEENSMYSGVKLTHLVLQKYCKINVKMLQSENNFKKQKVQTDI